MKNDRIYARNAATLEHINTDLVADLEMLDLEELEKRVSKRVENEVSRKLGTRVNINRENMSALFYNESTDCKVVFVPSWNIVELSIFFGLTGEWKYQLNLKKYMSKKAMMDAFCKMYEKEIDKHVQHMTKIFLTEYKTAILYVADKDTIDRIMNDVQYLIQNMPMPLVACGQNYLSMANDLHVYAKYGDSNFYIRNDYIEMIDDGENMEVTKGCYLYEYMNFWIQEKFNNMQKHFVEYLQGKNVHYYEHSADVFVKDDYTNHVIINKDTWRKPISIDYPGFNTEKTEEELMADLDEVLKIIDQNIEEQNEKEEPITTEIRTRFEKGEKLNKKEVSYMKRWALYNLQTQNDYINFLGKCNRNNLENKDYEDIFKIAKRVCLKNY